MTFFKVQNAFAENYDDVKGYDAVNGTVTNGSSSSSSSSTPSDVFKGYNPVTEEQMRAGQYWAAPFVNFFGTCIGFLMAITIGWMGLQTAIDLLYWAVPPLRGILAKQNPNMQGGGMMGMQPQQAQGMSSRLPIFVSDDMLQAMEEGGNVASQGGMNAGMPMGGGMGGGMGMMGGAQQAPARRPHILSSYAKKRLLSIIVLGFCITILFSSILLDTGINLGQFAMKLLTMFNNLLVNNT